MKFDAYLFGLNAKWYVISALILVLCFGLAHLARWHWAFDLLSHFLVQYAFFAAVFIAIFIVLKSPLLCLPMLAVCVLAAYETRLPLSQPWQFLSPPRIETERNLLRVAQYNKYYGNKHYTQIAQWINKSSERFDIVFILEAEPEDSVALRKLTAEAYPYTLPAEGIGPDFSLILSRHPFVTAEQRKIAPEAVRTRGTRLEIQPEGFDSPVVFYNFHTRVPVGASGQTGRNAELAGMAAWVAADPSLSKIVVGDFNITPYSPYFSDFVRDSGLRYQTYGLFPPSTWVSYFTLPFLKIPIDHMFYGDGLRLVEMAAGPGLGSDHQALIGVFAPDTR